MKKRLQLLVLSLLVGAALYATVKQARPHFFSDLKMAWYTVTGQVHPQPLAAELTR